MLTCVFLCLEKGKGQQRTQEANECLHALAER